MKKNYEVTILVTGFAYEQVEAETPDEAKAIAELRYKAPMQLGQIVEVISNSVNSLEPREIEDESSS